MKDDYYDNGLESAELENCGHPINTHGFGKLEEQLGPSQHKAAEIICARDHCDATIAKIQLFTFKKANEVLKPAMPSLSLNINNIKCVGDSQHENQMEEKSLQKGNTQNVDKNMANVPEEEPCSKDSGRDGTSGILRQLTPGRKQDTDESRAQAESKNKYRSLQEHADKTKFESLETGFRSQNKASDHLLKVDYGKMRFQLNQDNEPNCENTEFSGRNNPETGANPCKPEIFRGRMSPKYESVSTKTKVANSTVAGNNATSLQLKNIQAVATSHGKIFSTYVSVEFSRKIFLLLILSSVTVSQEDMSPLTETKIVLAGSNVRLNCSSTSENPVDWDYKPSDTGTIERLYYGNLGLMSEDVSKRFSVDANTFLRRYDLVISDAHTEDTGTYQCTEIFNEERQKLLKLVVLKEVPKCNTQSLNNGVMGEVVFNRRLSPVVLSCSVAVSDNEDIITLSIISTTSTSYLNTTALSRNESTVTVLMTILPLPAISLNNEVFKCKVSVSEQPADASANDDSISCYYPPIMIHYGVMEPIRSQSRSKTCNDMEKHSWCNPPCSYKFNEMEAGLCFCNIYYLNETESISWNCDDSKDTAAWKVAVGVMGLVILVSISLAACLLLPRRGCGSSAGGNYKLTGQV